MQTSEVSGMSCRVQGSGGVSNSERMGQKYNRVLESGVSNTDFRGHSYVMQNEGVCKK